MFLLLFSDTKPELHQEEVSLQQSTSKGGAKRKEAVNSNQKSKIAKSEDGALQREKNANLLGDEHSKASDLESRLEAQSRELWALKDDLKKHVTTGQLREMLEDNGQNSAGSELDLRDRW